MANVLNKRPNPIDRASGSPAFAAFSEFAWRLGTKPNYIYVAASMAAQASAMRLALQLMDAGFTVTSRWLRMDFSKKPYIDMPKPGEATPSAPDQKYWRDWLAFEERWGEQDLEDLERADTLVMLTDEPSSTGGYHVELGYFLGAGRTNIVVAGKRPNVFYWTRNVRWVPTAEELVPWLQSPEHGPQVISAPCVVEPVRVEECPETDIYPLNEEVSF